MLKVVVIDDEPKAIELLKGYIDKTPNCTCVASFRDAVKGLEFLQSEPVDLVLLDINMPKLSGISLAEIVKPSVDIIFTTAYTEYAVESYNLNAVDYLLKPITFERFLKAIYKIGLKSASVPTEQKSKHDYISIKSGYAVHRINVDDILFLEKAANYITYHTLEKKIIARESISEVLAKLPNTFLQIHKSYIIAIDKIEVVESNHVKIKDKKIAIGKNFKSVLLNRLQ